MNTAIVRPFVLATKRVFEKMLDCPCRVGKPAVRRGLSNSDDTILAIVEVSGKHEGFVVLDMPPTLASVAASLLVAPQDLDPSQHEKWAGDQIARLVKTLVKRTSGTGNMTFAAHSSADSPFKKSALQKKGAWLVVPIVGRFGKFNFAICLKPIQKNQQPAPAIAAAS